MYAHIYSFINRVDSRNPSVSHLLLQTTIYLEPDSEWSALPWKEIDAIVTTDGFHSNQLMCHAHSKGIQYGTLGKHLTLLHIHSSFMIHSFTPTKESELPSYCNV